MESAWEKYLIAQERVNDEYENQGVQDEQYRKVWDLYRTIRHRNNSRISDFRREANREHLAMIAAAKASHSGYVNGDSQLAMSRTHASHVHKERRDKFNAEIDALLRINRDALENAKSLTSITDSPAIKAAKMSALHAKICHEFARRKYARLKKERNQLKNSLNHLKREDKHLRHIIAQNQAGTSSTII